VGSASNLYVFIIISDLIEIQKWGEKRKRIVGKPLKKVQRSSSPTVVPKIKGI